MLNTYWRVTAAGLPLLLMACGGDVSQSLGPDDNSVQPEMRPADLTAAGQASRRHEITSFGTATFLSTDPLGCIESVFDIFGSEERLKDEQPGAPSTTGFALVIVTQFDQCTGTFLRDLIGEITSDAIEFDITGNLSAATLQATIPVLDSNTGAEFQMTLNVTWTGFGPIFSTKENVRLKTPALLQIFHSKAKIREADTSGTASLDGESFTLEPLSPGQFGHVKRGSLIVQFD
jgi:hypothetical protein